MLILSCFSLSAILAAVLIAIYILQHFMLGKEPTLMVPNWQNWAVKCGPYAACREGPGQHGWLCVRVHPCAHACECGLLHARARVHARVCTHVSMRDCVCACVQGREKSLGQVGRMRREERRDQGVYLFVKIEAACAPSALDPVAGLSLPSPGGPGFPGAGCHTSIQPGQRG